MSAVISIIGFIAALLGLQSIELWLTGGIQGAQS